MIYMKICVLMRGWVMAMGLATSMAKAPALAMTEY
jgi:hypothetical protein